MSVAGGPSQEWSGYHQLLSQAHFSGRAGRGFPRLGYWYAWIEFEFSRFERPVSQPVVGNHTLPQPRTGAGHGPDWTLVLLWLPRLVRVVTGE